MPYHVGVTIAEFERITDEAHRHELDEGRLIVVPLNGVRHGMVQAAVLEALDRAARMSKAGAVVGRCGFRLAADTVIASDVSFIRKERRAELIEGWPEFAPDLAVEIISPNDNTARIQRRTGQYLAAGAAAVWLPDPDSLTATVYEKPSSLRTLNADDLIDAPDLLPRFSVPVRTLFE
jgi:Uma2 family endonuclease